MPKIKKIKIPIANDSPAEVLELPIINEEVIDPIVNDPIVIDSQDPIKPIEEIVITSRKVKVFWHKSCINDKESTLTTLRVEETLTPTNASIIVDEIETPIFSLKRGKRIYYLYDVTPQEAVNAHSRNKELLALKDSQRAARIALK